MRTAAIGFCIWAGTLSVMVAPATSAAVFDQQHSAFTAILQKIVHVKGATTAVDYKLLQKNPDALNTYLNSLSQVTRSEFERWSRPQKMAFLINAYNAYTLQLVAKNYPVSSIKKIGGFFSSPWKQKFFKLFNEDCHLDRLEHEMLRQEFKEPRVHFALNCASIGCPRLRTEAYVADHLDDQLTDQAKAFLRDPSRNTFQTSDQSLQVSKIFDWFSDDFKPSVPEFVAPFMTDDLALRARLRSYHLKFINYDWGLNEFKP